MKITANREDRTISGVLLPFGEVGYTNVGAITVTAGALTLPDDITTVHLNMEHESTRPVGKATRLEETEAGIEATFKIADTTAGNDLLAEVADGLRTGFSVEFHDQIIRAGKVLGGVLSGAAAVVAPAFDSARVFASDHGDLPTVDAPVESVEDDTSTTDNEETEEDMTNENIASAGGNENPVKANKVNELTAGQAFRAIAKGYATGRVEAALTNVVHDDGDNDGDGLGEIAAAPAWLGEVYKNAAYVRKFIPLLTPGVLTSYREQGFRFTSKPTVAQYSGNKTEVPTGGITAEPVSFGTQRWAHGADIDRRFIDFGDSEVLRAFVEAQVESYLSVTDAYALTQVIAAATPVERGAAVTGVNNTLTQIIDGALALIADDRTPTAAIVGVAGFRSLLMTPKDQVAEFLSQSMGLEEGSLQGFRILPSANAALAASSLVLDGSTLRFKEFGGGSPVRVEAEHLANGGRDLAVFGYTSFQDLTEDGVVLVTDPAEGI